MNDFVREHDEIFLSQDNYLLQKVVSSRTIQRLIDHKKFEITEEYCREQSNLERTQINVWDKKPIDKRIKPDPNDQDEMDKFYITEMCLPYNPPPDERDIFVWYNDIRALSGTSGYLRIRDGYVYAKKVIWIS